MSVKQTAFFVIYALFTSVVSAQGWRPVALHATIDRVQPMTGLVVWHDNEHAGSDAVQLEFSYMLYSQVVDAEGNYDWSPVDELLDKIASRGHQAILRFRFIYPGYTETAVPDSIKRLPDYHEIIAKSEGRDTAFCDWSHPALKAFTLDFYKRFAERYDNDPRLAFVQVGFGLWAEYHIYDGPMELGKTFPDKAFQAKFFRHLADVFKHTPWSISIDAAEAERTPFAEQPDLLALSFGLFDDSFLHAQHGEYNEACWNFFGRQRYINAPAGGEFSYYNDHDQRHALDTNGPHGESFEEAAERFHISYMLANDQFRYQPAERIRDAGMATGYRFRVTAFETDGKRSRITLTNAGVAPIYYDAYPAINGMRSDTSLRGLIPGEEFVCEITCDGGAGAVTIECDRLVPGQVIQFESELMSE
ncbi:MAG: hypothetical protein R3C45_03410 [Phycisphaerales bacterium]